VLESKEPSAEQINAEVVPSGEEASPREESPKEVPIPEAIPIGIPVPARPQPRRPSGVALADAVKRPAGGKSPPWLVYAIPVAVGVSLGLLVLLVLWLLLRG